MQKSTSVHQAAEALQSATGLRNDAAEILDPMKRKLHLFGIALFSIAHVVSRFLLNGDRYKILTEGSQYNSVRMLSSSCAKSLAPDVFMTAIVAQK